ncbi:MAG: hypothetical protein HZC24_05185 [Rhodocyclales bacterium]|nr:hypothetical protein [Rhodocyclales bacterium]
MKPPEEKSKKATGLPWPRESGLLRGLLRTGAEGERRRRERGPAASRSVEMRREVHGVEFAIKSSGAAIAREKDQHRRSRSQRRAARSEGCHTVPMACTYMNDKTQRADNLPPDGSVRAMTVTEKQYAGMRLPVGLPLFQEKKVAVSQMLLF